MYNIYVGTHMCNITVRVQASLFQYGTTYWYDDFFTPYEYSHQNLIVDTQFLQNNCVRYFYTGT